MSITPEQARQGMRGDVDWSLDLSDELREQFVEAIHACTKNGKVSLDVVQACLGDYDHFRELRCLVEYGMSATYEGVGIFKMPRNERS